MYQQTRLSDTSAIGAPGPLPYAVANWHDAELADLDAMKLDPQFDLAGMGFWPVDVTVPAFDIASQVLVPPTACDGADAAARRWKATATVRAMTAAEFALANPVPDVISDRQCFQQLAVLGKITQDEALAAVTVGALPKIVTDGIAALPAAQQFPAKMMLCGATQFQRSHPMTPVFGRFLGLDAPGLDGVWRAGSLL